MGYFAYSCLHGMNFYKTMDEAERAAENMIHDCWHEEEFRSVCCGKVLQFVDKANTDIGEFILCNTGVE